MKKAMICALLGLAIACCGSALYAQAQDGSSQGQGAMSQGEGMHRMPMSTDDRLQHMTQMLNLTTDQQQKIRPILDSESQQMQSLRGDTSMAREDKMAKMRSIHDNTMSQITPILTPDQQKKWESTQARHMHGGTVSPNAVGPAGEGSAPPPQQ